MTAAEEKALLSGWFDTVQFDVDYAGIPPMEDEDDDEESRSSQLIDWFQNIASGMPPEDIDEDIWSTLDEAALGMSRSTARSIYRQEMEFQQLFGRANPYHDEKGKFAKGSSGGGGIATSTKTANISDTQAESLCQRLRTPDGGFTVDVRTGKDVTTGFAVAIHEDRSVDIPAKDIKGTHLQFFVDKNQDLFVDERNKFGAWHDPDTGQVWLDVSTVVSDRGEAIELGKKHNQISIFHLDDFEVINTGGTGRSWLAWRNEQRVFGGGAGPKVMARFNPNHDKGGKFASHKGGQHATPSPEEAKLAIKSGKEIARGADRAVYHREGDYFAFKRATSRDGIASNDREMEAYAEIKELGTGHKSVKIPEMARVDERTIATQFIEGDPLSALSTPEYNKLDSSAIRAAKSLTNGDWHDDQVILDNKGNLWVVDLSGLGPEDRANPNHDKLGKFASKNGGVPYGAMVPVKGNSREKAVAAISKTADGKKLMTVCKKWQGQSGQVTAIQTDFMARAVGKKTSSPQRDEHMRVIKDGIKNSAPNDRHLYRGVKYTKDSDIEGMVGKSFVIPPSSFSSDEKISRHFVDRGQEVSKTVVYRIAPGKGRAMPVELIGDPKYAYEKEWVSAGQFKVSKVEKLSGNKGYIVDVEHAAMFDWEG